MTKQEREEKTEQETGHEKKREKEYQKEHEMIFVTGPMFSGKRAYIKSVLNLSDEEFAERAVWNVEELVSEKAVKLESLADELALKDIVIAVEIGSGLVPLDASEREKRERAGRLACMLAERADTVIRVVCGCPQILKGAGISETTEFEK
ncbi:MAG: bifunctional adenosylcobinamide kinase/adenosylcobinamide-phosphate guanylyltransferase [Lachnospiraceae bacterium]|nr:bifunctional adenosylcobinamide kinase/adenosylcobinamide-phosphate guanylyltransferase [Lachnospiraceae bacterium]